MLRGKGKVAQLSALVILLVARSYPPPYNQATLVNPPPNGFPRSTAPTTFDRDTCIQVNEFNDYICQHEARCARCACALSLAWSSGHS
jgi:hypothetical protein